MRLIEVLLSIFLCPSHVALINWAWLKIITYSKCVASIDNANQWSWWHVPRMVDNCAKSKPSFWSMRASLERRLGQHFVLDHRERWWFINDSRICWADVDRLRSMVVKFKARHRMDWISSFDTTRRSVVCFDNPRHLSKRTKSCTTTAFSECEGH